MMSEFVKLVGEKIKLVRKARGLTQETLSEKSGLSEKYISDTERGTRNISLESLEKIMKALEIEPHELFIFSDLESVSEDKNRMIEMIHSLLFKRRPEEVYFLLRVAQEFENTFDKHLKGPI